MLRYSQIAAPHSTKSAFRSVAALVIAGAVGAVATISIVPSAAAQASMTVKVIGTIECPTGQNVVGAWVESSGGGSTFAGWLAFSAIPKIARYTATVNTNGSGSTSITVTAGCGGSTKTWASSHKGPAVQVKVAKDSALFMNLDCQGSGCVRYKMEDNTPAASKSNPVTDSTQCTWSASEFWRQMTGRYHNWAGNAGDWDTNAKDTGWTVLSWPRPDSLAIWQPDMEGAGWTGHVGYVGDVRVRSGKLQVRVWDRNWGPDRNGVWIDFIEGMKFIVAPPRVK